jgi:DNA modification methylase
MALGLIERAVHLWSNPGDLVLDPFSGVGSTGHVAIQEGRRFIGCELKPSYFKQACANLRAAEQATGDLFASLAR